MILSIVVKLSLEAGLESLIIYLTTPEDPAGWVINCKSEPVYSRFWTSKGATVIASALSIVTLIHLASESK